MGMRELAEPRGAGRCRILRQGKAGHAMRRNRTTAIAVSLVIASVILGGIWLTGRNHESAAPEEAHVPTEQPTASSTPAILLFTLIASVDGAIDAELRGDGNQLQRLLRYASVPCSADSDGEDAPRCRPGEGDGTTVEVIPIGDCRRSFQRPDEFREEGITSLGVRLYAVYDAAAESYPPGEYIVVFLREPIANAAPAQTAFALSMTEDGITGINYGCDQAVEEFVASQHLSSAIVAPPHVSRCRSEQIGQVCQPAGLSMPYTVCSEGYGWVRPSLDDQRRYLTSLGGEFQQFASDPGLLFAGAYTTDALGTDTWHYAMFWALVGDPEKERYALARTGLWSATPNTKECDRSGELTLLIERQVTAMQLDGSTLWISSRSVPGYFQFVEYAVPVDDHGVGYRLLDEDGTWIDGCCN